MHYKWHRLPVLPPEKMPVIVLLSDWQMGLGKLTISGEWSLQGILYTGAPVIAWCNMPNPCAVETA